MCASAGGYQQNVDNSILRNTTKDMKQQQRERRTASEVVSVRAMMLDKKRRMDEEMAHGKFHCHLCPVHDRHTVFYLFSLLLHCLQYLSDKVNK